MQETLLEKTRSHYDKFPFIKGGTDRIVWWREYLRDFLPDEDIHDRLIGDVGASVGEISRGLLDRGARLVCLDVSLQSLKHCQQINADAQIFHSNALNLPFPNDTFDHTISIGVLHHTPDCRRGFSEVARVTAPGGRIVVFLYNYWSVYNLIYHAFKPIRANVALSRVPLWGSRMLQPFVRFHLGQTLSDQQLRNLLGDLLWTPQATFHSVSEVHRWGCEEGLTLTVTKKFFLGYANVMCFEKRGVRHASVRREVVLRCLKCGAGSMAKSESGYTCSHCGHMYSVDGKIIECAS